MEQLLLVTSCDSPAGIGASLRTHVRTNGRTDGHTDVTLEMYMCDNKENDVLYVIMTSG